MASRKLSKEDLVGWQKRLAEKGWAATNWPKEHGGAAFTPTESYIFDAERARVGATGVVPFGITMVAPVIMKFGTDEQKAKFLPSILNSDVWFCQGYSEPGSGSDLASLKTKAEDKGDHYLLNGAKMWITNGTIADVAIVWAKLDGVIRGFIVEKDDEGFSAPEMKGKHSLRASITSELVFQDCKIPKDRILPDVQGLKGPLSCLTQARYGITWGSLGAAMGCFHL